MLDTTRTTTVLLEGLHDHANAEAWTEFDRRYRPLIMAFARRLGLSEADAADAAQETMTRFLQEYRAGKYDRERGRLRSWLMALAKTRIAAVGRRRATRREARGESAIIGLSDEQLTTIWSREQRTLMLQQAMDTLRRTTRTDERTIRVFEMLVINLMPVAAVAEELGITAQDVYLAKSRVAQRLRKILAAIEATYDEEADGG